MIRRGSWLQAPSGPRPGAMMDWMVVDSSTGVGLSTGNLSPQTWQASGTAGGGHVARPAGQVTQPPVLLLGGGPTAPRAGATETEARAARPGPALPSAVWVVTGSAARWMEHVVPPLQVPREGARARTRGCDLTGDSWEAWWPVAPAVPNGRVVTAQAGTESWLTLAGSSRLVSEVSREASGGRSAPGRGRRVSGSRSTRGRSQPHPRISGAFRSDP